MVKLAVAPFCADVAKPLPCRSCNREGTRAELILIIQAHEVEPMPLPHPKGLVPSCLKVYTIILNWCCIPLLCCTKSRSTPAKDYSASLIESCLCRQYLFVNLSPTELAISPAIARCRTRSIVELNWNHFFCTWSS
jgi:hypothetical protein